MRTAREVGQDPGSPGDAGGDEVKGALQHVVEQLWAPAIAAGQARVRVGEQPPAGWHEAERYLVLPSVERATMLLPAGPRAVTAASLMNYRGLRRRLPNLQRTVLGRAVQAGARLPFPLLSVQVPDDVAADAPVLPLAVLARQLGGGRLYASIGVRTGANRKATLQLVDAGGAPRGFAKLAWGPLSSAGVRREEAALRSPGTGPARAPELLASGEYHGLPYLVTAPLPESCRGVRSAVTAPTAQELFGLCPIVRLDRFAATTQLTDLRARLSTATQDPETGPVIAAAERLLCTVAASVVPVPVTSRWHGDLTPWNTARDPDGTLWCWDWESSEPDAVAGLDALHWHVTALTEGGSRPLDGAVLQLAHRRAQSSLVAAGVPREARPLVTGVYAAALAERACDWAAQGGGWDQGWVVPAQLADLLATAERMVEVRA